LTRTLSHQRHISSQALSTEIFRDPKSAKRVQSCSANLINSWSQDDDFPRLNGVPEVVITGRANSGKSSLFNAVLGRKDLINTSSKPGRTRCLDFFSVGPAPGKVILVDAPGYGNRGRPEWGRLFDAYIQKRQELRRIYITFNAKHSVNRLDEEMLSHLSRTLFQALSSSWALSMANGSPRLPRITQIQPVITKADYLSENAQAVVDRLLRDVHNTVKRSLDDTGTGTLGVSSDELAKLMCLPPMLTSVRMNPPFGIEKIRKNIVDACNSPV